MPQGKGTLAYRPSLDELHIVQCKTPDQTVRGLFFYPIKMTAPKDGHSKVIVFVRYLDSVPADAMTITGDVPERKRGEIIKAFRDGEDKVLYITYGCGAFGLNLQFCHHTIFAEQVWDYANIEQAEARTYRIGQDNDVTYHYLHCGNSGLEDMIIENIRRKGNLLQTVKEEIQNTKGGAKEWVKRI